MTPRYNADDPEEQERVMRHQLWSIAYYLGKLKNLVNLRFETPDVMEPGIYQCEISDVLDLSDELHPQVFIALNVVGKVEPDGLKQEVVPEAEEHSEGVVPSERSDEQLRSDTPPG
jgi:hypothetical protein